MADNKCHAFTLENNVPRIQARLSIKTSLKWQIISVMPSKCDLNDYIYGCILTLSKEYNS